MNNKNTKEMVALVVLIGIAGAATYTLRRIHKSVKKLDNIELDFGNDSVLSSLFKKD